MTKATGHRELRVWQEAMDLVSEVYRLTKLFPKEELFGLSAQLRRAAVSVPSNIAEGAARLSRKEFRQYLSVARGSLAEIETQLLIAENLGYGTAGEPMQQRIQGLFRLLAALIKKLEED